MKCDLKRLAEIRRRLSAARPGPWRDDGPDAEGNFYVRLPYEADVALAIIPAARLKVRTPEDAADAAFLAHSHADVTDLLEDLLAARAEIARLLSTAEARAVRDLAGSDS